MCDVGSCGVCVMWGVGVLACHPIMCTVSIYCHPQSVRCPTYTIQFFHLQSEHTHTHAHVHTHTHSRPLLPPLVHMQEVGLMQYVPYFKNSLAQEAIMKDAGTKFFAETQLRLGDPFTLSSYLNKPFERMARYKLFIVVRCSAGVM